MSAQISFANERGDARGVVDRRLRSIIPILILALILLNALALIGAFYWRVFWDAPLYLYTGLLIEKFSLVPYRDFFETSMPGTFLFNYLLVKYVGVGDFGFHTVNAVFVGVLSGCTYFLYRGFDRSIAVIAALLVSAAYLGLGPVNELQRDFVGFVFMWLAACILVCAPEDRRRYMLTALSGICVGVAITFKPHLGIGLLPILLYEYLELKRIGGTAAMLVARIFSLFAGVALPLLACVIYLQATAATAGFLELLTQYLPLHLRLSGDRRIVPIPDAERPAYLLLNLLKPNGAKLWAVPSFGAILALLFNGPTARERNLLLLLLTAQLAYFIYPAFSGQFWTYHWLPFQCVAVASSACCLLVMRRPIATWIRAVLAAALIGAFGLSLARDVSRHLAMVATSATGSNRIDVMVEYLRKNVRSGETVQPLDWVAGGAINAMLLAKVKLGTPFLYDYHFFHHTSEPIIQILRARFIAALLERSPEHIIDVDFDLQPPVIGTDADQSFAQLDEIKQSRYDVVLSGDGFRILKLKDGVRDRKGPLSQ